MICMYNILGNRALE
ncbi:unnamed protein product, partial [Rotaria sp. Silwood1]